jgi:hypothetical protein|tara:strand:+ start:293 stop:688 length:396 start_codon:yes stop_codon:yes gene_type:complete
MAINKNNTTKQEDNTENFPARKEDADSDWGKHPNSIKALEKYQFRKGEGGNPTGSRPSYKNLKKALKKLGDEQVSMYEYPDVCSDDFLLGNKGEMKEIGTRKEVVLRKIWDDAMQGDDKKIQLLIWLRCFD